jgi:hypothetical protein
VSEDQRNRVVVARVAVEDYFLRHDIRLAMGANDRFAL